MQFDISLGDVSFRKQTTNHTSVKSRIKHLTRIVTYCHNLQQQGKAGESARRSMAKMKHIFRLLLNKIKNLVSWKIFCANYNGFGKLGALLYFKPKMSPFLSRLSAAWLCD